MSHCPWIEDVAMLVEVPGQLAWERTVGLGFWPISPNFGTLAPEIKTHPKLIELIRIK